MIKVAEKQLDPAEIACAKKQVEQKHKTLLILKEQRWMIKKNNEGSRNFRPQKYYNILKVTGKVIWLKIHILHSFDRFYC